MTTSAAVPADSGGGSGTADATTGTPDPAAWRVAVGTARGAAHEERHLPNQDNAKFQAVGPAAGVVAAVADGHGAGRHFRSLTGSMLAVRAACAVVAELTDGGPTLWTAESAGLLRDQLPQAIVGRWRELVARHLAAHPYTAGERSGLDAAGDGPEIPYGSTLLVAVIAAGWLVCAQIGDGDMLAVRPDGGGWIPVDGDERLDGLHTTSLCQAGAVSSFRTAAHDLRTEPALALLLGTDGYGNAQVTHPWQPAVASELAGLAATRDHDWFERQVLVWAERCASATGSGDDTTIALLLAPDSKRLAAAAAPPAGQPAATEVAADVTTQPHRQHRHRWRRR
jgi:Protein phosphatase 2C